MPEIELPRGFRFAGVHCGIKDSADKLDLSLLVSDTDAAAAGVYTQNVVHAASVAWNRSITPTEQLRAIVVNSGNANACTGERGTADNRQMATVTAEAIGCDAIQCGVMSTGIIGVFLPMDRVCAGISAATDQLTGDDVGWRNASHGILTTDNAAKMASRTVETNSGTVRVAGMAKGAGMIGPDMATLLAVIVTDAKLSAAQADKLVRRAAEQSFNCISVDGHTSTSDCFVLMANGAAQSEPAVADDLEPIATAVDEVSRELARMIPADGEGATHRISIRIRGCQSDVDARRIGKTVANSVLVKTAIYGADPNWGRIVSAAGYAGVEFDPLRVNLTLNGVLLLRSGLPREFDAAQLSRSISAEFDTSIELDVGEGPGSAEFWTSDLTVDYVRFNAEYHT